MTTPRRASRPWLHLAALAASAAALVGVFALYARPDFLVMLSNQLWACF